ncbi:hypothetical protein MEN41_22820 [Dolichospermum sp. ST_con]|jgi:hypothetical protein|nr:hypothetical protein [Dolichospermum sp. ST_con]MDD1420423.1 hypothetical protein [Dolichospermum sp. ST_sed1]MDD1425855.1 hypothetical protein [Dolichospermum sp. ST_sed9]MDD1430994.1 hypothetical protein [Dolichospermum sp. ST_sed6]MDD1438369.1 hypothetical protein [Dolichospermum sp. ST_sed10]MDD1439616.1 hypothetical protein [Dolichospermum sp. ST_sed3]MDD1447739.1 hypothetical protein [Dolichospermum sp. ST_sed8]MDD1456120.1 hypothetical protein [Dolichospermum sp. ST_sed7]MDD145900
MQSLNITLPDTLANALNSYIKDQENLLPANDIVEDAIIEFLSQRGYLPPKKPIKFIPATKGSGFLDTSVNHDQILAEEIYLQSLPPNTP